MIGSLPQSTCQGDPLGGVPMQDAVPDLLGGFGEPEQLAVLLLDDAFVDQEVEIDGLAPIALAHQHDRHRLDLARLDQRQHFEQFVEGAEPARKRDQRLGPQQEMQLAHREIVEAEAEVGRDVRVLPFVRIIHGKGTGALRQAVREELRSHPLVSEFRTGENNEGGEGVTVAKLVQR